MAFLIVGAVQLIGFTSSGIASGSIAASMMSAAGPVAAGSLVAVCQSIGAKGAVSAGTALIANTTLVGAVGAGVAAVGVRIKRRIGTVNADDHTTDKPTEDDDKSHGGKKQGPDQIDRGDNVDDNTERSNDTVCGAYDHTTDTPTEDDKSHGDMKQGGDNISSGDANNKVVSNGSSDGIDGTICGAEDHVRCKPIENDKSHGNTKQEGNRMNSNDKDTKVVSTGSSDKNDVNSSDAGDAVTMTDSCDVIPAPDDDEEDDGDNNGEGSSGGEDINYRASPNVSDNKQDRARFRKGDGPGPDISDGDDVDGRSDVIEPNIGNDTVDNYSRVSSPNGVRVHIGVRYPCIDNNNEANPAICDGGNDEVEGCGGPVLNSNNELCDPYTGEVILEI